MSTLHTILRMIHISLGFAGLALFWLILAAPKGTRRHVRYGQIFTNITWIVGGTALVSSLWALVHLDSFAPIVRETAEAEWVREIYYLIFAILLYLSAATLSGAVFGVQVMRKRGQHDELRRTSLPYWLAITGLCAVGLIAFGVWRLVTTDTSHGGLRWEAYFIPVLVGSFGLGAAWHDGRYVFGPPPGPRAWLYQHVWQMCGTGVAFHTAFLVFGANRLFGFRLPGAWALIPWVAPPLIGMTLTARYVRQLRRTPANWESESNREELVNSSLG